MNRAVALTGATGFIGAAVARRLAAGGRPVRALLRRASVGKQPADIAVDWINGDLEDMASLRRLVHRAEAVVHCAGTVRGASRAHFERVNVDGVTRLVQAVNEQHPAPRFLLISSLAAREPHLSAYAASKRHGEYVLAARSDDFPWAIFRPSAVYGPGDREMLPVFRWMARGIAPVLGSGKSRFSVLYIDDLAEAIIRWLEQGGSQQRIFELHDGKPGGYSWNEVVDTIAKLRGRPVVRLKVPLILVRLLAGLNLTIARACGYAPMLTPGKVREFGHSNWVADNQALSADTGWVPRVALAEGLRRTLGWNSSQPEISDSN